MQGDLFESYVWAYEVRELIGRDLSQTFESCDLRVRSEVTNCVKPLLLSIAIAGDEVALLLILQQFGVCVSDDLLVLDLRAAVANTEEWRLQDIDMPLLDQLGIELQEESDDQQTDVHTVYIGIGGHDHLVVSKVVEAVLDVQGSLKEVELLILIDHLFRQAEAVEWLTTK